MTLGIPKCYSKNIKLRNQTEYIKEFYEFQSQHGSHISTTKWHKNNKKEETKNSETPEESN